MRAQRQRMETSGQNECHARRAHTRAHGTGTNRYTADAEALMLSEPTEAARGLARQLRVPVSELNSAIYTADLEAG